MTLGSTPNETIDGVFEDLVPGLHQDLQYYDQSQLLRDIHISFLLEVILSLWQCSSSYSLSVQLS